MLPPAPHRYFSFQSPLNGSDQRSPTTGSSPILATTQAKVIRKSDGTTTDDHNVGWPGRAERPAGTRSDKKPRAGIGWPGFAAVASSPGGARFIAPDAGEIARIRARHTFLKPLTIPANSYPTQTAAIDSVGSWSFVLARESLPDDVAYRLARFVLAHPDPQARGAWVGPTRTIF